MVSNGLPNFWSTVIAKALVGDQPCLLEPWLRGRMKFPEDSEKAATMAKWKADHTQQLQTVTQTYADAGWNCDVERFFRVTGQYAICSGKADLVCQHVDKRPLVIDVKGGRPRDSDVAQVAIEMVMLPLSWQRPSMQFDGLVVYADGTQTPVLHAQAEDLRPRIFALLKLLGASPRPIARPSRDACRFCDAPATECNVRYSGPPQEAQTVLF